MRYKDIQKYIPIAVIAFIVVYLYNMAKKRQTDASFIKLPKQEVVMYKKWKSDKYKEYLKDRILNTQNKRNDNRMKKHQESTSDNVVSFKDQWGQENKNTSNDYIAMYKELYPSC